MFHPNKANMIPLAPCRTKYKTFPSKKKGPSIRLNVVETVYDPVKDIEEYIPLKTAAPRTGKVSAIPRLPLNSAPGTGELGIEERILVTMIYRGRI
jgi:hypothetical protein